MKTNVFDEFRIAVLDLVEAQKRKIKLLEKIMALQEKQIGELKKTN